MKRLLYNDISYKLEQKINEGLYSEGEKLPSERLLSDEYGVSRNVIRESVRLLSEKGLLEIMPGKGIYVISPNGEMITDTIKRVLQTKGATLHEMLEVREALETSVIIKAVARATEENILALKAAYQRMEINKTNVARFTEEDALFHTALAESTQNNTFLVMINTFFELTGRGLFLLTRLNPQSIKAAQEDHWDIIQSIESRDESSAVATFQRHMGLLRQELEDLRKSEIK